MSQSDSDRTSLVRTTGPDVSRRQAMRIGAAAVGTAAVGASSRTRFSPVGTAEAIAPIVVTGGFMASVVVTEWALRDWDPMSSDDPPEGLTADALIEHSYELARQRESNDRSTHVDNRNIVEGIENSAWADGKIAAIEALNDQLTESEVTDAGIEAVNAYEKTVLTNLFRSWNETVETVWALHDRADEHPELEPMDDDDNEDVFHWHNINILDGDILDTESSTDYTFEDGTTMEVNDVHIVRDSSYDDRWNAFDAMTEDENSLSDYTKIHIQSPEGPGVDDAIIAAHEDEYGPLYDEITAAFTAVRDGMAFWVSEIYESVQAGELDPEDLLTPRELAEMTAEDEEFHQAIADLMALNVAVDLDREAEVYLDDIGATLYGRIAWTEEGTLSVGTVDPDVEEGTFYFTYDVSEGHGEWDAHESGVDGGEVTFTEEPFEATLYVIETTAGETAEVDEDDFTEDEGDWVVDISDQVDDGITEVDEINFYSQVEETQFETIILDEPFEIVTFTDPDGEEHDDSTYERGQAHDDENYITQEEWDAFAERHEELIQDYEDALDGGGIFPGFGDLSDRAIAAGIIVVGIIIAALGR